MADKSKIEWTDATWNPIRARNLKTGKLGWHCEHATTGCEHCYSEGFNQWRGTGLPFKPGHRKDIEIFLDEDALLAPLRWKPPRMIFVCSMTDLFADFVKDEWIDKLFAVMALCPQHTFQVLTKRAERMRKYFGAIWAEMTADRWRGEPPRRFDRACASIGRSPWSLGDASWPLANVWLGVSCERQEEADERIPFLLQTPAAIRFISAEPLLGPIDLTQIRFVDGDAEVRIDATTAEAWVENSDSASAYTDSVDGNTKLDWVIVGGESGPHARPMHPQWARHLRDQCAAAGISYFFKQFGEWGPSPAFEPATHAIFESGNHYRAGHVMGATDIPAAVQARLQNETGGYTRITRFGKKAAGRLLDGIEHNGMPQVRA